MNFRRHLIMPLMLLGVLALLTGCSDEGANPAATGTTASDDYDQLDLSLPYGGLTTSDEDEAFGDDLLKAEFALEDDELANDPLAADPEVLAWERMGSMPMDMPASERPRFTYLRLRWGMLSGLGDSLTGEPPCDITDWTGEIHTDRGTVVVKRVLRFERPIDHIIWPRLDRQTVAFVSHTACHWDGLVIQIIEPPLAVSTGDEPLEPNRLHINLPLFSGVYDVADLADLDEVTPVDDAGNSIQLTGFGLDDIAVCPKGFLSGVYRMLPADAEPDTTTEAVRLGRFMGAWTDLSGRINGFMRGGYGVDEDGVRVFVGKAIDRRGRFHALIQGTWEPGMEERELATFRGEWFLAGGRVDGVLGGEAHPVEDYPGGFYVGRWSSLCDPEAEAAAY